MKRFLTGLLILCSLPVSASMQDEPMRLTNEGYDMSACQFLPSSSYNVGVEEETLKVTFINDTGDGVTPAYTDRKGKVKFLRRRGIDQIWKDSTYIGTIWVWFSDDKTCLGISPSKFEWSDDYQMVTDLVN
jgi:hypothetical protein